MWGNPPIVFKLIFEMKIARVGIEFSGRAYAYHAQGPKFIPQHTHTYTHKRNAIIFMLPIQGKTIPDSFFQLLNKHVPATY